MNSREGETRRRKILLVEPEHGLLQSVQSHLGPEKFEVEQASFSEAANRLTRVQDVFLVIADIDTSGECMAHNVTRLKQLHPDLALIVLSEYSLPVPTRRDIEFRSIQLIRKPFQLERLVQAVHRVARNRSTTRSLFPCIPNLKSVDFALEYRTDELDAAHIAHFVASLLFMADFCSDEAANVIEIAIHEALYNALEHGNLELASHLKTPSLDESDEFTQLKTARLHDVRYSSRPVRVRFRMRPDYAKIVIADEGPGFNYAGYLERLKDREEREDLFLAHGRGLLMILSAMDEVFFNARGNEITLVKYRENPAEPKDDAVAR